MRINIPFVAVLAAVLVTSACDNTVGSDGDLSRPGTTEDPTDDDPVTVPTDTPDVDTEVKTCVHPDSGLAVEGGGTYYYFDIADAVTQTECDAHKVTSTCSATTGLFEPAPPDARSPTCLVEGQTCAYTMGAGIAEPTGNAIGDTVTGYVSAKAAVCGAKVTRTCQANGNWSGAVPVYSACTTTPVDDPFLVKIDNSKIPKGDPGVSTDMLVATSEIPTPSDIGAFRTGCKLTHMSYDDPIVSPGKPGASRLNAFFGNTGVNAYSTPTSIATTGNSTCRGGTINRTAYWVPAMIDTRTHAPVAPMRESNFYYKTGYSVSPSVIQPMPEGLRMVAGDPNGNPSHPSSEAIYACVWEGGNSNWGNSIPDCPAIGTSWLIMGIDFHQCWDGVNLDAPDHRSHMAAAIVPGAPNTGHCPSSHPIAIPAIAYQILYPVTETGQTKYWRLSSDHYDQSLPGGYSGYGAWFDGWKPEIVETFVEHCDRAMVDCHSHLLGDGRAMVIVD